MNDVKTCPCCGKQLHSNAQYCMYCMTPLQSKQDITPRGQSRKIWGVIGVVLLILGILSMLCFLAVTKGVSREETSLAATDHRPAQSSTAANPSDSIPDGTYLGLDRYYGETEDREPTKDNGQNTKPSGVSPKPTQSSGTAKPGQTVSGETAESTGPAETEPSTPSATKPADPIETEPSEETRTDPTVTTPTPTETVCSHYYLSATCVAPLTCRYCGDTRGSADTNAHKWNPLTATVHHDEVGHYEKVQVSYRKTVYLCFFCGYNQAGYDSMDALRAHVSVHSKSSNYEAIVSRLESVTDTREVWDYKDELQWVVDQEAYDETVVVGYECSLCKGHKDP